MNALALETRTPNPTEYGGIVFRSKCEAVFARGLDLQIKKGKKLLWEYEPGALEGLDGWIPDFLIMVKGKRIIYKLLVEYKPNRPTDVYKRKLINNFLLLHEKYPEMGFMLVVGNPFDENISRIVYEFIRQDSDLLPRYFGDSFFFCDWEEARTWRFDLE